MGGWVDEWVVGWVGRWMERPLGRCNLRESSGHTVFKKARTRTSFFRVGREPPKSSPDSGSRLCHLRPSPFTLRL